jgi:REP element-mobilizing transposase RayT
MPKKAAANNAAFGADLIEGMKLVLAHRRGKIELEQVWPKPVEVKAIHKRVNMSLAGYDYSTEGAYFVTVCARDHRCLFGGVTDGEMQPSRVGDAVTACWNEIPIHFPHVLLDDFALMPNHVHGILVFSDPLEAGQPTRAGHARPQQVVVGSFKAAASRRAGVGLWQRSYWDRIIRTEGELNTAREYIELNPSRWPVDLENPKRALFR